VIVNGFLNVRYGMGDWVLEYEAKCVYLNHNLIYDRGLDLAEVQNEVAIFAMQFRGVSHALSATAMRTSYFGQRLCPQDAEQLLPPPFGRRHPEPDARLDRGAGALLVVVGVDVRLRHAGAAGILRRRRRAAAHKAPRDMTAMAPTVARMLEITEPAASEGEVLPEIIDL